MRLSIFLIVFAFLFSSQGLAQKITERNLFTQVNGFFEDYTDLIIQNDYFESDGRMNNPIVYISLEEIDWFVLSFVIFDNDLLCVGSANQSVVDPKDFLSSGLGDSSEWFYEENDDGDLSFVCILSTSQYSKPRDMSAVVNARFETLLNELADYGDYVDSYETQEVQDSPHTYDEMGGFGDLESVKKCAESIEKALKDYPYKMRSMIRPFQYCQCMSDMIVANPDLVYGTVNPTSPEGKMMNRECFSEYCPDCEENGVSFEDVFGSMSSVEAQASAKKGFVKGCVNMMAEEDMYEIGYAEMEEFCECMYDEILLKGDGVSLQDYFDPNSTISVETSANCMHLLGDFDEFTFWNDRSGLSGCYSRQYIPVVEMSGGYHVKVTIGGETKYMLIDSGAHEILINEYWAQSLLEKNAFVGGTPIGYEPFILADGSEVSVVKYIVRSFAVGDCTYRNFVVGVVPEGGMLFGMGFLGLFDSWEIDSRNEVLILD